MPPFGAGAWELPINSLLSPIVKENTMEWFWTIILIIIFLIYYVNRKDR